MAANAGNQRIIPLEEGWNDEIKAKVRTVKIRSLQHDLLHQSGIDIGCRTVQIGSFSMNIFSVCIYIALRILYLFHKLARNRYHVMGQEVLLSKCFFGHCLILYLLSASPIIPTGH